MEHCYHYLGVIAVEDVSNGGPHPMSMHLQIGDKRCLQQRKNWAEILD